MSETYQNLRSDAVKYAPLAQGTSPSYLEYLSGALGVDCETMTQRG